MIAQPRQDRWHRQPTALLGGIAIFFSFLIPLFFFGSLSAHIWILAAGAGAMFILGLYDDLREMAPQSKFAAQLVIACIVVAAGIRIHGLTSPAVSVLLTIFWLVSITNAINILDNMDGLAAGISLVAACSMCAFSHIHHIPDLAILSALLIGASAGFWIYNFNPARIFMGDCGSLFLGFILGGLTVLGTWQGGQAGSREPQYAGVSNLILTLVVPVTVLIIPIFDTALVSFTRTQAGRPISQGGRDHTSHRLVLLGYSETRTVLTLMSLSAAISTGVLYLSGHSQQGVLVIVSIATIIAMFFGTFLSNLDGEIYGAGNDGQKNRRASVLSVMMNKKQILQLAVDIALITAAYVSSYLLKFDGQITPFSQHLIEETLPFIILVKVFCFWAYGLYRGQWRYVSVEDLWQILKAVGSSSTIILVALLFLVRFQGFSRVVFVNDALLTLVFIGGTRLLLRLFREYFSQQAERRHTIPVVIVGAGDGGDLLLRELRKRKDHDFLPIGFIDDDPAKKGQIIHGIKVIGDRSALPRVIKKNGIRAVFISILSASDTQLKGIFDICKREGVICHKIRPLIPVDIGSLDKRERHTTPRNAISRKNSKIIRLNIDARRRR